METDSAVGLLADGGQQAIPEDQGLVDAVLVQEKTAEPLYAQDAQTLKSCALQLLIEAKIYLFEQFLEALGVLLAVEEARNGQLSELLHDPLETNESIALSDPPEVFAVLVGETVEDEGCQLVHALAVDYSWIVLQEDVDESSEAVIVVGLPPLLRQVDL